MDDDTETKREEHKEMSEEERQRILRRKNIAVGLTVLGVIVLFYVISLVRLGGLQ